jgi:hypothetical protein
MESAKLFGLWCQAGKGIEQAPMRGGIRQCPVIMLAMDFNKQLPELPEQLDTRRLIIDESACPAIRQLNAAQNEIAIGCKASLSGEMAHLVVARQVKYGRHLPLRLPGAHQPSITTPAKCERESIKQNALPGTRFTGQHHKASLTFKVEPIYENDVTDGKPHKHESLLPCPFQTRKSAHAVVQKVQPLFGKAYGFTGDGSHGKRG